MAQRDEDASAFNVVIPKKFPVFVVVAFLAQLAVGIWSLSGIYSTQQETNKALTENMNSVKNQLVELKSSIYTRNEALLQFDAIRQENSRQDAEIRELRGKIYGK